MKFLGTFLILLLATVSFNSAASDWSNEDTARQAVFLGLLYVDYRQSRVISESSIYYETNNILGEHPTRKEAQRYFLSAALLHTGVMFLSPSKARKYLQYVSIAVESGYVYHNYNIGVRVDF